MKYGSNLVQKLLNRAFIKYGNPATSGEVFKKIIRKYIHPSIGDFFPSIVHSPDDAGYNDFIFELAINSAIHAHHNTLEALAARHRSLADSVHYNTFPGEHYRLLRSLAKQFAPTEVVEIGTFTGMSSLALLEGMPVSSHLTTFDIVPWRTLKTHLNTKLFDEGRITQVLADVSDPDIFAKHFEILQTANLIFCDGPKDGVFEYRFLQNLTSVRPNSKCLLLLDDIRFVNMQNLWHSIASPKLDLTSFGHFSGTGLVDITLGLKLGAT